MQSDANKNMSGRLSHAGHVERLDGVQKQILWLPGQIRKWLVAAVWLLIIIALVIQVVVSPTINNLVSSLCAGGASLVTFWYILGKRGTMQAHPLSSLVLLGVNISSLLGPLLYRSLTLKGVETDLNEPLRTFGYVTLFQFVLILSHFAYRKCGLLQSLREQITHGLLVPAGLFAKPAPSFFWVLGIIGVASTWFTGVHDIGYGDFLGKFFQALRPFAYAPYVSLFFLRRNQKTAAHGFSRVVALAVYTIVIVVVAMIKNSRVFFGISFITLVLTVGLLVLSGTVNVTRRHIVIGIGIGLTLFVCFSVLSNLAVAMVAVRNQRTSIKGVALAAKTIEAAFDQELLAAYQARMRVGDLGDPGGYNEVYVSNPLLARLITIKFDDNMALATQTLGPAAREALAKVTVAKLIAILPTPVLRAVGSNIDKEQLEFSLGDYIWHLARGGPLGSYRTGSITFHGVALLGKWFFVIALVLAPIAFLTADSLTLREKVCKFSPFGLLVCYQFWTLFYGDSLLSPVELLIRGLPQLAIVYSLILFPSRLWRRRVGYCRSNTQILVTPSTYRREKS